MRVILLILTAASLLFGAYTRNATTETVYDDQTDQTWQDSVIVSTQTLDWNASIDYCEALDFAGVQDWRLPNINELLSITDLTTSNPAIDSTFQNTASSFYWSSTTYAPDTDNAWYVYFNGGVDGAYAKTATFFYVRCVRSGQIPPSAPQAVLVPALIYLLD